MAIAATAAPPTSERKSQMNPKARLALLQAIGAADELSSDEKVLLYYLACDEDCKVLAPQGGPISGTGLTDSRFEAASTRLVEIGVVVAVYYKQLRQTNYILRPDALLTRSIVHE